jgi:hypothetical protein
MDEAMAHEAMAHEAMAHEATAHEATAHEAMGLRGWLALAAARAPLAANPSDDNKGNQEAIERQSKVISDPLAANPSAAGASTGAAGLVDGGSVRLPFPQLALRLRLCAPAEWQRFHSYHYKTAQLSTVASTCLLEARVALGGRSEAAVTRAGTAAADAEDAHHDAEAVARDAEDEASVYVPAGFVATIPHSGKPLRASLMTIDCLFDWRPSLTQASRRARRPIGHSARTAQSCCPSSRASAWARG